MKKILLGFLIGIGILFLAFIANAQVAPWTVQQNYLKPTLNAWTLKIPNLANSTSACITADGTGILSLTACGTATLPGGNPGEIQYNLDGTNFAGANSGGGMALTWGTNGLNITPDGDQRGYLVDTGAGLFGKIGSNVLLDITNGAASARINPGADSYINGSPFTIGATSVSDANDIFRVYNGRSIFDGTAFVAIGTTAPISDEVLNVNGKTIITGNLGVGSANDPTTYNLDAYGTIHSSNSDGLGGFLTTQNYTARPDTCGDTVVQEPEQCDDGDTIDNNECTNMCRLPGETNNGYYIKNNYVDAYTGKLHSTSDYFGLLELNDKDGVNQIYISADGTIKLASLDGIIKGTNGVLSSAIAGVDYVSSTAGNWTGTWQGNSPSAFSNYFTLSGTNLYPTSTAYKLGIGTNAPSSTLHVVGTSTFIGGNVGINTTPNATPLSVQALTSYAFPTTNTRNGTFSIGNTTNAYGMIFGVDTATGKGWISSQRFSGGAANYPLILNPLGSYVNIGTTTNGLATADGSLNLMNASSVLAIKSGGLTNTELTGSSLKIGQTNTTGYAGYLYFKSDNSVGASMYWGKTSGAGVSFANTAFIPTANLNFALGDNAFRWAGMYSAKISDNGINVGMLDATNPFDVLSGSAGLHIKSTSTPTLLLQGVTPGYNSQSVYYYSATSLSRILYKPAEAKWELNNEFTPTNNTNGYGDIVFQTNQAGTSTLVESLRISGWNGNVGIGNTGKNPVSPLTVFGTSTFYGHVEYSGSAPTLENCGTGATISSPANDNVGKITVGTGTNTCTLVFNKSWLNPPVCMIDDETSILIRVSSVEKTTSTVLTGTGASLASDNLHYFCAGIR